MFTVTEIILVKENHLPGILSGIILAGDRGGVPVPIELES